ncbi:MAG: SIMPL domain-containing protein [Microbacterium sp.]|uniref:SIMPL domain-containing protein n=1 Tax=Microbacterium sp. TaxID=51671 RepID=UPI003A85C074
MSDVIITVRGEHETRLLPERAVVHLTIVVEGAERGAVVERVAALTEPVRADLAERQSAGDVAEWSSQRAAVWSDRPWSPEGQRLAPVHHASVDFTVVFADFAALSFWAGEVAVREGVQLGWIDWRLTPETRARVEREVATRAVQVAVQRAEAYALALELSGVTPLSVADSGLLGDGDRPEQRAMFAARAMSADAGGPVLDFQPEEIRVASSVDARFAAR